MSPKTLPSQSAKFFACGILAALCWSLADMLLVGFVQELQRYPLLSQLFGDDAALAALMVQASSERLLWGVLLATFSLSFYLIAIFGLRSLFVRQSSLDKGVACLIFSLLFIGYTLSPLGHAGFYYVGLSAKTLLHAPIEAQTILVEQWRLFQQLLDIHWRSSVGLSAIGWGLLLVQTLRRRTLLPRTWALVNPIITGALIALVSSFFPSSVIAAMIGSATFNLAQFIFFGTLLVGGTIKDKKEVLN